MKHEIIQNQFRNGIIEKSIVILRRQGLNDNEIRKMLLKDFSISEKNLDKILKADK